MWLANWAMVDVAELAELAVLRVVEFDSRETE
jgi:hypothetical protein